MRVNAGDGGSKDAIPARQSAHAQRAPFQPALHVIPHCNRNYLTPSWLYNANFFQFLSQTFLICESLIGSTLRRQARLIFEEMLGVLSSSRSRLAAAGTAYGQSNVNGGTPCDFLDSNLP